jgi:hypothetical protein
MYVKVEKEKELKKKDGNCERNIGGGNETRLLK